MTDAPQAVAPQLTKERIEELQNWAGQVRSRCVAFQKKELLALLALAEQALSAQGREEWNAAVEACASQLLHVAEECRLAKSTAERILTYKVASDICRGLARPVKEETAYCPFCKKEHVGGDVCLGHHP